MDGALLEHLDATCYYYGSGDDGCVDGVGDGVSVEGVVSKFVVLANGSDGRCMFLNFKF